ncbi:structural cement protein Gp24 [Immundisolibacter sp.]
MSQLSYSIDQAVGFEGQLADLMFKNVESKTAEGEILIGKVVTQGSSLDQVVHPDAAAKITDLKLVKGVAIHQHNAEQKYPAGSGNYSYLDKSAIPVLTKGKVWVLAEDIITAATSTVNCRYAGVGSKGALRGAAVGAETAVLPNAKWKTSTTAVNQLAQLEINL